MYLLALIGLSIPAFGYFMNGFAYDSNRWCFVISLLTAVTFTFTYENLFQLKKKEKLILFAEIAIYGILTFVFPSKPIVKLTFILLVSVMAVIFLLQLRWFRERRNISRMILYALVLSSLALNGYGFYSKQYNNYTQDFLSKREVISNSGKGPLTMIKDIRDRSFYRIETYGDKALNESLSLGYNDVSGYFSLMDGDVTTYLKGLEVLNQRTEFRFQNLDTRTLLDTLSSVKYFVTKNKDSVPYGYTLLKEADSGTHKYYLFRNSYALPLGYTYENYMLREDYDKLSALEKQNAMLNTVVLENDTDYAVKTSNQLVLGITKPKVKIKPGAGIIMKNNQLDVRKAGASITLEYASKPNSETYIRLGKFNINQKADIMVDFYAKGDLGVRKKINVRSAYYSSYFGKEDYLINLGYSANGQSKAVITFPQPMTFSYGSIDVCQVDMSHYADQVKSV